MSKNKVTKVDRPFAPSIRVLASDLALSSRIWKSWLKATIVLETLAWRVRVRIVKAVTNCRIKRGDVRRYMRAALWGHAGDDLVQVGVYSLLVCELDLQVLVLALELVDSLVPLICDLSDASRILPEMDDLLILLD